MSRKKTKRLLAVALAAVVLGILLLLWNPLQGLKTAGEDADFTLRSASGKVSLSDYRGKVVLIYFGYASCPDICPTSLSFLAAAFSKLEEAELVNVRGIFISVDPERDTLLRLAEYTTFFHENIVGVTGSAKQIDEVARRYGVIYKRVESDSAMGYTVDHSSVTYVIDPDGKLVASLPHGTTADVIVKEIRALLQTQAGS